MFSLEGTVELEKVIGTAIPVFNKNEMQTIKKLLKSNWSVLIMNSFTVKIEWLHFFSAIISPIALTVFTIILVKETKKLISAVNKSTDIAKISARISDFYGYKELLNKLVEMKSYIEGIKSNFNVNPSIFKNENMGKIIDEIIDKYTNIITIVYSIIIKRLNPEIAPDFTHLEHKFSKLMTTSNSGFSDYENIFKNMTENLEKIEENLKSKLKDTEWYLIL